MNLLRRLNPDFKLFTPVEQLDFEQLEFPVFYGVKLCSKVKLLKTQRMSNLLEMH
jgi:hypothetical protein